MRSKRFVLGSIALLLFFSFFISGCALNFYKQSPRSNKQIKNLKSKIVDLEREHDLENKKFEAVKRELANKLRDQIADNQISLEMDDRGLVIILSDDVLFAPGKAQVKDSAHTVLDKVSRIIKREVPGKDIGVSGHTDNTPIKHSKWKSNWELSTTRATNVLHYMVRKGVSPKKLSATGYGEHRPVASNTTASGKAKNRRVEIVILPEFAEQRSERGSVNIK